MSNLEIEYSSAADFILERMANRTEIVEALKRELVDRKNTIWAERQGVFISGIAGCRLVWRETSKGIYLVILLDDAAIEAVLQDRSPVPQAFERTPMPVINGPVRNTISAVEFRRQLAQSDLPAIFEKARRESRS